MSLPQPVYMTKEEHLRKIQEKKLENTEKFSQVQQLKEDNLSKYELELRSKIEERSNRLNSKAKKDAINRYNKEKIEGYFKIIHLVKFLYQIQRFINYRNMVDDTGFHAKAITNVHKWYGERKKVTNIGAAKKF